ncbi:MAG: citrate lyase holo-[Oscillospiraceae bacterium]|nr:citrate lyase holo-[acyl-carrier protein] synthase [Oscillospiraceae bacterium]
MSFTPEEVTLEQMLAARERRAFRQRELLKSGKTLISFTMNIAGPQKVSPLIRRGFYEGCSLIEKTLSAEKIGIIAKEIQDAVTGCECLFLLDTGEAKRVKRCLAAVEDRDPLGRLFDIDVISPESGHISRSELGFTERPCLVCSAPGRSCASRRVHSVQELQKKTNGILKNHFMKKDADTVAMYAVRALLYEVCTTPKPGLVDMNNTGSHSDMDMFTFVDSVAALAPYFRRCAEIGMETSSLAPGETFRMLRTEGRIAEGDMLRATGGVNTHKGAIFSLGTVCGAAGRLVTDEGLCTDSARIARMASEMVTDEVSEDFDRISCGSTRTAGETQFVKYGIRGCRGQVADGLPAVIGTGLPCLREAVSRGKTLNEAGAAALLHLIADVEDGCMISRGGVDKQRQASEKIRSVIEENPFPDEETIRGLDDEFIAERQSPGGCADLLAISLMMLFLEQHEEY